MSNFKTVTPVTSFILILFGICVPILTWIASPNPNVGWDELLLFLIPALLLSLLVLFAPRIPAGRLKRLSGLGVAGLAIGAFPGWINPVSLALFAVGAFGLNMVKDRNT